MIRNWTYVFWVDFKNAKQLQIKLIQLQEKIKNKHSAEKKEDD